MLKGISYVVETNSEQERADLREFVLGKKLGASVIYDGDGHQLIAIMTGDVWFLCTTDENRIKSYHYDFFSSAEEFVEFFKKEGL